MGGLLKVEQYWKQFAKAVNARKQEERAVLLLAVLAVLGYAGYVLFMEPVMLQRQDIERRLLVANAQVVEESNRQADIRISYTNDPDAQARKLAAELQTDITAANRDLDRLYGQLIDPREMSVMLTSILQRETSLELISLNNKPGELLMDLADQASASGSAVALYRHGMQMVFEGSYLETIRYLRSLEALESNFFWERMDYDVLEYPKARITLDIYTLSTEREWIGV